LNLSITGLNICKDSIGLDAIANVEVNIRWSEEKGCDAYFRKGCGCRKRQHKSDSTTIDIQTQS